jgi:hypothetical protein
MGVCKEAEVETSLASSQKGESRQAWPGDGYWEERGDIQTASVLGSPAPPPSPGHCGDGEDFSEMFG